MGISPHRQCKDSVRCLFPHDTPHCIGADRGSSGELYRVVRFCFCARCRTPFYRAPWQVCAFQQQLPHELDPRPPPRHPTAIGPGESTYCFRLITNTNLTSITGPYTSRTSIVIS